MDSFLTDGAIVLAAFVGYYSPKGDTSRKFHSHQSIGLVFRAENIAVPCRRMTRLISERHCISFDSIVDIRGAIADGYADCQPAAV